MTHYQAKKMSELLNEGWTAVPDPEVEQGRMGAQNIKSPEGVVYRVAGDGSLEQLATAAR
jgi:hypothetical protein